MYDAASLYWWQTLAILTYMCGSWFSSSFVSVFVIATVLLAMDFWTVKNVSGRLMVGLRWWSEVIEDGSTIWRFEAHEGNLQSTSLDIAIFWVGLFVPAVVWVFFGVGLILRLSFDWLLLVTVALTLNSANIIGYVRCKKDAASRISSGLQGALSRVGVNNVMGQALQSAAGSAFGFN